MSAATIPQAQTGRAHGTPNWVDLHTAKADEAAAFYQRVLGWAHRPDTQLRAVPEPPGPSGPPGSVRPGNTTTMHADGLPVGEIVGRADGLEAGHLLSNWFPYVEVVDIEATLALVEPVGGLILSPVATRVDGARVATILDPADAVLRLWERSGLDVGSAGRGPGNLTWIELETGDLDLAQKFYGEVFGWDAGEVDDPFTSGTYLVFTSAGDPVAGAVHSPLPDLPASWCSAFAVDDTDAATSRAVAAGGVVLTEPVEMVRGRQSVIVDPTGAVFALLGPAARGPRPL